MEAISFSPVKLIIENGWKINGGIVLWQVFLEDYLILIMMEK